MLRSLLPPVFSQKTVENGKNQGQNDIADEDADSTNGVLINNVEGEVECCAKDENILSPWGKALQKVNISGDLLFCRTDISSLMSLILLIL